MELKVRMYVRKKNGRIGKILTINNKTKEMTLDIKNSCFSVICSERNIKKSSANIIDLIEVGDYVNGYKVFGVGYNFQDDYVVKVKDYDYEGITHIHDYQIKSIVTKEQFESISYKVGE